MDRLALFFALCYFAQGMAGIIFEPLSYLLKDGLGLSASESASFIAWMTLPFLLKPLFGALCDALPVAGLRRRPHLAAANALSAACLLVLAAQSRHERGFLLALLALSNVGLVLSDVACDGVMVEQGRAGGRTGFFQAVQIGTLYASLIVTGLGAGWLSARVPIRGVFALAALFPAAVLLGAGWAREEPVEAPLRRGARGLGSLLSEGRFWALCLFIFLWSFQPFLGTAQFYYQAQTLGLGPVFIGFLGTLGGISGLLGAACYGWVVGRLWSMEQLLRAAVWVGAALSLLYLLYRGPASAALVTVIVGVGGVFFRLALMDLAARSCPAYAEATAFAVYMAVFNLAAWASNTVGGKLYDALKSRLSGLSVDPAHGAAAVLVLIGAACTAACAGLLPCLEAQGTMRRAPR